MSDRPYDIVILGATGFTGQLTAEYLCKNARDDVHWAIAGRNLEKLAEVKSTLDALSRPSQSIDVIEASCDDPSSLEAMAERARVVITTVGPYIKYGEPVVAACVRQGTDYVDITGEPQFVDHMLDTYDAPARDKGLRIVNCCGFDSIPHDLGALFSVRRLPSDQPIQLRGFVHAKGTFSGGTWHSAVNAMAQLREHAKWRRSHRRSQDLDGRRVRLEAQRPFYEPELSAWAVPFPTIDPDIIRRSAIALPDYGPDFRYGHYVKVRKLSTVIGGGIGIGAIATLAQFGPTRQALLKVRDPGEGPTPEQRANSWFTVRFIGNSKDGSTVVTEVSGGDPGYDETAKMLAESAICLAKDRNQLPAHAGVLTPAVAMGSALTERLTRAGIRFDIIRN